MFEHHMTFVNRSNSPKNVGIYNGNVLHAYHNGLAPGATWSWTEGWPIGYDIRVYQDTEATRLDGSKENPAVVVGYVMIAGSIVVAAIGAGIEFGTAGAATPAVVAIEDSAFSAFTGGVAAVSGLLAVGGAGLEIGKAVMNPAKLSGLFGTDNYHIEIGGNAIVTGAELVDGQLSGGTWDYDSIGLTWGNETSGWGGTRGYFTWVWTRNPLPGEVRDIAVMPDGSIIAAGMDNGLLHRATLSEGWTPVPDSKLHRQKASEHEQISTALLESIAAASDGSLFGLFKGHSEQEPLSLWRMTSPGITQWKKVPNHTGIQDTLADVCSIFCDGHKIGILRGTVERICQTFDWSHGFRADPEEKLDIRISYISPGANRDMMLITDAHYLTLSTDGYSGPYKKGGDHQRLMAVDQLPSGHPIAVDEDHHLCFGVVFDEGLLPGAS